MTKRDPLRLYRQIKGELEPIPTPDLARMPCRRCPRNGATIAAFLCDADGEPRECYWCGPDCARQDGWPWIAGADKGRPAERRSNAGQLPR